MYFNGGSSMDWLLSGLESKAFGESPWVDTSIGVASFDPCFFRHSGASEGLTATSTSGNVSWVLGPGIGHVVPRIRWTIWST